MLYFILDLTFTVNYYNLLQVMMKAMEITLHQKLGMKFAGRNLVWNARDGVERKNM